MNLVTYFVEFGLSTLSMVNPLLLHLLTLLVPYIDIPSLFTWTEAGDKREEPRSCRSHAGCILALILLDAVGHSLRLPNNNSNNRPPIIRGSGFI
jgi:hypothetical protein